MFGVLFAHWSLPILKSLLEGRPRVDEISIHPVVLGFALGVSLLTGILFGILPALRIGWRGTAGVQAGRVGPAAGLLMESLWRASRVDLGFSPDQVLTMRFNLPQRKYDTGHRVEAFREELLRRISALAGVTMSQSTGFEIEGMLPTGGPERNSAFSNVSPDYFHAMGIPLLRGRDFQRTDRPGSFPVSIVNWWRAGFLVVRKFWASVFA